MTYGDDMNSMTSQIVDSFPQGRHPYDPGTLIESVMSSLDELGYSISDDGSDVISHAELEHMSCSCHDILDGTKSWDSLMYSEKERYRAIVREVMDSIVKTGHGLSRTHPACDGFDPNSPSNGKWFHEPDVPLVISVTGHYNISPDYQAYMEDNVRRMLSDIRSRYPHTRIVVMTALDQGADMDIARMSLDEGAFIAPVFPMPFSDYMDMRPGRDVSEVDSILSHERCFDPYIMDLGVDTDAFRSLAVHLVSHSHMLLSLWDGNGADRNGGAFDTTDMAIHGIDPVAKDRYSRSMSEYIDVTRTEYLDIPDDCLVYWICCERGVGEGVRKSGRSGYIVPASMMDYTEDDDIDRPHTDGTSTIPYPDGSILELHDSLPQPYTSLFANLDRFNSEMCEPISYMRHPDEGMTVSYGIRDDIIRMIDDSASRNHHYLLEDTSDGGLYKGATPLVKSSSFDSLARRYSVTDSMSMECQRTTRKDLFRMSVLTVVSTLLFSLLMLSEAPLIVNIMYTAVAGVLVLMTSMHNRNRSFHRYIDYRCICECLRVEYYRAIMGIRDPFCVSSYGYMRNEIMWARAIIKGWGSEFANRDSYIPYGVDSEMTSYVCWIKGQEQYHAKKRDVNSRLLDNREYMANIIARVTLVLSIALMAVEVLSPDIIFGSWDGFSIGDVSMHEGFNFTIGNVLKIAMIVTASISMYVTYSKERVFGGTPNEIAAKKRMYSTAARAYDRIGDRVERKRMMYELGEMSISEVNDWVFEHKTRDFRRDGDNLDTVAD